MKVYKISLKALGSITQIPDSQKLFGAMVSLFAGLHEEEKVTAFVKAVRERKLVFHLSNLMPEGYLPVPQECLIEKKSVGAEQSLESKEKLKKARAEIKKRNFLKEEELWKLYYDKETNVKEEVEDIYPYIKIVTRQQQRASIDSLRYGIDGLDSRLYSVPYVIALEVKKGSNEPQEVKDFQFYLQLDETELGISFYQCIKEAVAKQERVILGKRASQGLNTFCFTAMKEEQIKDQKNQKYLNTGMLLPDAIQFKDSILRLFTSERKPFDMKYNLEEDPASYYISFIEAGSIVVLSDSIEKAGKVIESPYEAKSVIFGNAFLYPIPERSSSEYDKNKV